MMNVITVDRPSERDEVVANGPEEATPPALILPDHPLIKIRPNQKWAPLDWRELWAHRDLFAILVIRDVTIRYKQTLLGIAWAVVQPIVMMGTYTVIFGRFGHIPSDGIPYPLFAFAALLPWTFLSNAVQASGNSLINNSHLITKVYFPRILIPAASVGMGLVDFGIAAIVLAGLMLYYHVGVTWKLLMFPPLLLLTATLCLGLGVWAAALNVRYRDVRHVLPFFLQVWMFLSPIIYPLSLLPPRWQRVAALNPLYGIIENIRVSLFNLGRGFDWYLLGCSAAISLAILVSASFVFRRVETSMADVI